MGASSLWTKEREAVPCLQNRLQSCVHQGTLFTQFCSSIAGALVFPFNAPQLSRVMYAGRIHTVCDSDSSWCAVTASKIFKAYTADLLLQPKMPGFGLSKTLAAAG